MKKFAPLIILAAFVFGFTAKAQQLSQPVGVNGVACAYNNILPTIASGQAGWAQCDSNGRLIVSGSFSATLGGFAPSGTYSTLAAGTTSANVALPVGANEIVVYNNGSVPVSVLLGTSNSVTAIDQANDIIQAGGWIGLSVGSNTYIAAITHSGTAPLVISGGSGLPTGTGGGGSGSGSINITQFGGSNVVTGTGASGSGIPRVTVSNDSTLGLVAGSAIVGKVGIDQTTPGTTNGVSATGQYFYNVVSSTLTRASNTTAYAANETVCLAASVTVCAPLTISIANTNTGKGIVNHVSLLKSGSSTTNASFTIWFFSAAPGTSTPSQFDATSYTGPRAADIPNYIGNANCSSPTATSDTTAQVWYECSLSNPNTGGALDFQALSGSTNIDALISVTAAYTPASAETFNVYVSGLY